MIAMTRRQIAQFALLARICRQIDRCETDADRDALADKAEALAGALGIPVPDRSLLGQRVDAGPPVPPVSARP